MKLPLLCLLLACIAGPAVAVFQVPLASHLPVTLTSVGGLVEGTAWVGADNSVSPVLTIANTSIDIFDFFPSPVSDAYMAPSATNVVALSGFFSVTTAVTLSVPTTITINCQLWRSAGPAPNDVFTTFMTAATPAVNLYFTSGVGTIAPGTTASGVATFGLGSIPINAGDRIIMVLSASVTGDLIGAAAIVGTFSGGIGCGP